MKQKVCSNNLSAEQGGRLKIFFSRTWKKGNPLNLVKSIDDSRLTKFVQMMILSCSLIFLRKGRICLSFHFCWKVNFSRTTWRLVSYLAQILYLTRNIEIYQWYQFRLMADLWNLFHCHTTSLKPLGRW